MICEHNNIFFWYGITPVIHVSGLTTTTWTNLLDEFYYDISDTVDADGTSFKELRVIKVLDQSDFSDLKIRTVYLQEVVDDQSVIDCTIEDLRSDIASNGYILNDKKMN